MFFVKAKDQLLSQTEALVIGLFHENKNNQAVYEQLNNALGESLDEYVRDGDISNNYKEISKVFTLGQLPIKRLYIVGLGRRKELTPQMLKKAFGKLFKQMQADHVVEASLALDSFVSETLLAEQVAEAAAEAFVIAPYHFAHYKTSNENTKKVLEKFTIITDQTKESLQSAFDKGFAFGQGVNTARHLVHLPGNLLTATDMAEFAISLAKEHEFEVEILDKEDMQRLGMGALLAVNQGSEEPPKMIVLKYQGRDKWDDVVGLVGKGITFDTGGYSLKSKDGIVGMKGDMGGAAAVLGAMDIIGRLKPKKNVVAVIPSTDNMISGGAFKPDDVITSLSGKTIEVLNTDAEGRLALADAITYAKHHKATKLIDVATLTGGVIVALGDWVTGAMTNNDELYEAIKVASDEMDEPIWQLPYTEVYKQKVRGSQIADLSNSPGRKAHPIMAGAFVGEFAEDTPWVHLDIAGTSTSDAAYDLGPKGPTGVMARTLAAYILS